MKNKIWTDFNNEKLLEILKEKLTTISELCDSINDNCNGILDGNTDEFNTMRLVKEIQNDCNEIQQTTEA